MGIKEDWVVICQDVKNQCIYVLILELERRFSTQELMNAIGIVYPQYWVKPKIAMMFLKHL
jgi:hypothetical protein